MEFPAPLISGTLIRRYKRFLADVRLDSDEVITAHCANTGSMTGCALSNSPVLLSTSNRPGRKYPHTWELVQIGENWVGINTALPNRLVEEAVFDGTVAELQGYETASAPGRKCRGRGAGLPGSGYPGEHLSPRETAGMPLKPALSDGTHRREEIVRAENETALRQLREGCFTRKLIL